jgi:hypothetical protein
MLLFTIFTYNVITTLLGIFSHEIEKKSLFHIRTGADILPQNAVGKSLIHIAFVFPISSI